MIKIYTDGAYSSLRDQGGWAFVVLSETGEKTETSFGGILNTTNNRMEMFAFLQSLIWLKENGINEAEVYLDSLYVINSMIGKYSRKKNLDLWEELDNQVKNLSIKYNHIKGHSGNKFNDLCDILAVEGSKLILWK